MKRLLLIGWFWAIVVLVAGCAGGPAKGEDFSAMRGANYVPSYSRNDVQTWMDFDPEIVDRELGYAQGMGLNTVRVFLQYAVYERDPKLFLERFEKFLALCEKHQIRMMPVVFDSCFGAFPDLADYKDKDWMANPGQNRLGPENWPKLEAYVRDVVGGHRADRRIVLWDVMNEPWITSFNSPADKQKTWTFLDHMLDFVRTVQPQQPIGVGVEFAGVYRQYPIADKVDVLAFHNYTQNLREDIRAMRQLAAQHGHKPVIINEVVMRPQQTFEFAMPVLREEKIGWCFWELMRGRTQFSRGENPIQGIVYPDGACADVGEVAAVMNRSAAEARRRFPQRRWTAGQAWEWYRKQPWIVGFNYVPSTACNTTEFWQAETFDEKTIDRELGWAQGLGFNSCRVFVQYLVWKHDPEGLKKRLGRFVEIADRHGISTVPVLFDDCAFGRPVQTEPYLGKQRDPIPGMVLPSWTPSPGLKAVADRAAWPDLGKYVKDVVGAFARDRRVLMWDLYNEPGNSGMGNKSLPLVEATFAWARAADPIQPLTMAPWGAPAEISGRQLALSDIVTYHFYGNYVGQKDTIQHYRAHGRPVICTEWMARRLGSSWQTDLPLFKEQAVGCYNWGLVNGRTQAQYSWSDNGTDLNPKVWFHDLFHQDGTPYDPAETAAIKKTAADKTIDWSAFRPDGRPKPTPVPGFLDDTSDAVRYTGQWTLWEGAAPAGETLHYSNTPGNSLEFTFEGSELTLLHKVGPDCGTMELLIDGKPVTGLPKADDSGRAIVDTYGAEVDWNHRLPLAQGLSKGKHTLKIIVQDKKNAAASDRYVQIVGFIVK